MFSGIECDIVKYLPLDTASSHRAVELFVSQIVKDQTEKSQSKSN